MPVNTPSDVADPLATITAAEHEASSLDILVCGRCQNVFHFIEEFQDHKVKNICEKADKTALNLQGSKKPQVWAFLIWKNSQQKASDQQGSWKLYQRWCNMPETQRQSWVTAGRNIQAFINLSHARELNKVDNINKDSDRDMEDDFEEDFVVEKIVGKRFNPKKKQVEYLLKWEGYPPEQNTWEPLSNLTTCRSLLQEYERVSAQNDKSVTSRYPGILKKDSSPQVKLQSTNSSKPPGILPNKFQPVDKKSETNVVPTLQTQRKIVPATPLTNSTSTNKILSSFDRFGSALRAEASKFNDISKSSDSRSDTVEVGNKVPNETSATSNGENMLPPIKKRPIQSKVSDEHPVPEKRPSKVTVSDISNDNQTVKKASSGDESSSDESKRCKLSDNTTNSDEFLRSDLSDTVDIPQSGIFKKSDLKDKYPSINNIFGTTTNKTENKPTENQKGLLRIDHSVIPELISGIYKMSVANGMVKIDMLSNDKRISGTLPTMPGPKGGVVVLGSKHDVSKVYKSTPSALSPSRKLSSSPEKSSNILKLDQSNSAFRGIFPKSKLSEEPSVSPSILKQHSKSDFLVKTLPNESMNKKPLNSSLRKVLGNSVPRGKGKVSVGSPGGITRAKTTLSKSVALSDSESSSARLLENDGLVMEFCEADNSDVEDYAFPDDFPQELDMEPLSPPRPLTLDPETGQRLMRAEGEPTPEPTPEPSPEPSPVPSPVPSPDVTKMICKEEKEIENEEDKKMTEDDSEKETYTKINGNTFKVTTTDQLELLQNATTLAVTGAQNGTELKTTSVVNSIADEESNDNTNMITITGEDGLVYQVANAKLEGDTIVVASGDDEQQCVFVTEDGHQVMQRTNEDGSTVLTLESAYADAVAQLVPNQVNILPDGSQIYVKQEENGQVELVQIQGSEIAEQENAEDAESQLAANADENSGQVVAQLIEAGEPAPGGGPRRVVLLLPDGNLMVTEVDEEQFAALELGK